MNPYESTVNISFVMKRLEPDFWVGDEICVTAGRVVSVLYTGSIDSGNQAVL